MDADSFGLHPPRSRLVSMEPEDIHFITTRLPSMVQELLMSSTLVLAGGFIRATLGSEPPQDIDLFGSHHVEVCNCGHDLAKACGTRATSTENALTVKAPTLIGLPVQFITKWTFDNPKDLLMSFDFTVARAAVWFDPSPHPENSERPVGWLGLMDQDFFRDLAARRLSYVATDSVQAEPGGSVLRMMKFLRRGYAMPLDSLARLMAATAIHADPSMSVSGDREARDRLAAAILENLRDVDPPVSV